MLYRCGNSTVKWLVIVIVLILSISINSSFVNDDASKQILEKSPRLENETRNTTSEGTTATDSGNEKVTTFSDGTSNKKLNFGNMPPLNGTAELKIPKDANVTEALMNVSGLIHNICLNVSGENSDDNFGESLSYAGDVNNDGYSDIIVSAPNWNAGKGRVYIYYGDEFGISSTPHIIDGENATDNFGKSVSYAGDVNNDGYDDIIVGAPKWQSGIGRIYVFHGSENGITASFASEADAIRTGDTEENLGASVSYAGDLNNDGYDDVVIGAPVYDGVYGTNIGRVYVFKGTATGIRSSPSHKMVGVKPNATFGNSVSNAGDINNDEYDDIIVGAVGEVNEKGRIYIYYGTSSGIDDNNPHKILGEDDKDYFGCSVSYAGDVNNDGYGDVIVGAKGHTPLWSEEDAGIAYIFYGNTSGIQTTNADYADTFINGTYKNEALGNSVSYAGDVNNDGCDDVIVGACQYESNIGRIHVFHGSNDGIKNYSTSILGENGGYFGINVSYAGDVNNDGYDDVIVGENKYETGKMYVYTGSLSGISNMTTSTFEGSETGCAFGYSISNAGDINNDGYDDLIVGEPEWGNYVGRAHIYLGGVRGVSSTPASTIQGKGDDYSFGQSVSNAGDVNNDGYDDIVIGSPGNGTEGTNSGTVYVFYGSADGITATMADDANAIISGNNDDNGLSDQGDSLGFSVSCAGDVNNDGYDDIVVGAPYYGNKDKGRVYVFQGSSTGIQSGYANSVQDWYDDGEGNDCGFGYSVSYAGDVNNDGYDDIIASLPYMDAGKVYIYYGPAMSTSNYLTGETATDQFGNSVSNAGDVNNDGYDDVIVGASVFDHWIGRVYIYHGTSSGISDDAVPSRTIDGKWAAGEFGKSVSYAGDVDYNGYDDVVAGADYADARGDQSGEAYVFYSDASGVAASNVDQANLSLKGEKGNDRLGLSVSYAGDINGDGYDDVVVSAYHYAYKENGSNKVVGKIYIIFGSLEGLQWWSYDYIPYNPKVDVGANGTVDWSYIGYYNGTETMNFTSELKNYLAGHQNDSIDGYIYVPINITCDSRGTIMLDNLNIEYISLDVGAPTNVSAVLEGIGLQDVNITWSLSIDDGAGKNNVDNYALYRNTSYDHNGAGYDFLAEIPNGTDHYVDIGAGDSDPSNYFYYLQANSTSGKVNKSEEQAGKFVRDLAIGKQLFSIPLNQSDTDITTVLQTIEGNYDYVQWYNPLDAADHWKTYSTAKPSDFNDLLNIDRKIALWINITSPDSLTVAGVVPKNTTIQLYKGWNFIGYPSFTDRTVSDALGGLPYEQIEGFDETTSPYYLKILTDSDIMEAGCGYWIRVSEDCTWTVEQSI